MTKTFTGWHMTAILIAFFGVVIAVNVFMATEATRTFGGTVVENSYVASQRFNHWLAAARAQTASGYAADASGSPGGLLELALRGPDGPVDGALVTIEAEHPLGRLPGRRFTMRDLSGGRYVAVHGLPHGRWRLRIAAHGAGRDLRFAQDVQL